MLFKIEYEFKGCLTIAVFDCLQFLKSNIKRMEIHNKSCKRLLTKLTTQSNKLASVDVENYENE